ncbi:RpiR family transcriptional regulator [Bacillus oleivorans]|uniref:RpiR family transcriptional regulator n=1 Tax=Bacillus oleivorans TaxID=1448271 RepID=A0A285CQY3_9BACI|nr:MurR/RpiR family transcriptional regulator [Bacillus oleivorans]SNX69476.1 RpiR family transcriptional regulator [Bacillus oleivorans]
MGHTYESTQKDNSQSGNILVRLQNYMKAFTKSEIKVAETVMTETADVIYYSITDLAEKSNVGETTVLRFCRKIGFKGYQEFKLALAKDLVKPGGDHSSPEISEEDNLIEVAQKITASNAKAINDTLLLIDPKELEKVVSMVCSANQIHFYGVGTSGYTALDAKYKFLRVGFKVDTFIDPHMQSVAASTLTNGDLAIGFSVSGSTKDTIDSLKVAKNAGASIVCITNFAKSPITRIADGVLLTAAKELPLERGAMSSIISQLHIIDILWTAATLRFKDRSEIYKEKTAKSVIDKHY